MNKRNSPGPDSKRYANRRAILALLQDQQLTPDDLAFYVPITPHNIRYNLRALKEQGLVRICGWAEPNGSGLVPAIWTAGSGPDAKPPSKKKRRSATWQRHYAKNRQVYRARYALKKGIAPNPFAALLDLAR
jgi:DNA-binding transcriptional ArsR family regulator